ncbi:MDR family MFS transporter [Candidatus Poriferisocius sp.]|uniref:MDR family MFS transporter n=1 Tax=Candidatus Poriferisocius sp. TaxID=3101276 RepID=UPI003B5989A5
MTGLPKRQVLVIILTLMLAQIMAAVEGTVVSTALPTIIGDLGGRDLYTWVFTSYFIASTASTPLWGKLSDLWGRKGLYQAAIVIFMVGSVAAGVSSTMTSLVVVRAIQGLGAGGLFSLSMAILADVISPRERGRYQGYMGGIFALATILGPLVGGLLVDYAHWRWVFFMVLPLGVIALVMSVTHLELAFTRRRGAVDYTGAGLLVVWVIAIILALELGGDSWAWVSFPSLGLLAVGGVGLGLFIVHQRRTAEAVLPPRLFRLRLFNISSVLQFITGAAMLGAGIFGPLFLQVVTNVNATRSGLLLVPMTMGMLITSVGSGQILTRTGRYKAVPIAGACVLTAGCWLLSTMDAQTTTWTAMAYLFTVGCGVGGIMQVLLVAVQNIVPHGDLGAATSASNFFRSLGQTFGAAVLGVIFTARLDHYLFRLVPGSDRLDIDALVAVPTRIDAIEPTEVRAGIVESFARAIADLYWWTVPMAALAVILAVLVPEYRLRDKAAVGT